MLFSQARSVFKLAEPEETGEAACSGDPVGGNVWCEWQCQEYCIKIITPQGYGANDRFGRTRGTLQVDKTVSSSSAHLEWINPSLIASGFGVGPAHETGDEMVKRASGRLRELIRYEHNWQTPHDVSIRRSNEKRRSRRNGPLKSRSTPLYCNSRQRMFVGQAQGPASSGFLCPSKFFQLARLSGSQRFEFFLYEFELSGRHSFEFRLAV